MPMDNPNEFDMWYKKLEKRGEVDAFGSSEYRRMHQEWEDKVWPRLRFDEAYLKRTFNKWYKKMEKKGRVDAIGTGEYRRMYQEWEDKVYPRLWISDDSDSE
jgi:hypothetical protein